MIVLELVCLAIVGTYVVARVLRARGSAERLAFALRFGALAVASFIGEDTVIRAYGYYAYAPGWSARLDQVPLVIVLVWPVVIDSAATLARAIERGSGPRVATLGAAPRVATLGAALRVATLGAAIVLADASLIEPIAVRAGLWRWVVPGLFDVPLVGTVGWAFFAWAAILVFEMARGIAKSAVIVIAPLATHLLIVASWWIAFRWIGGVHPVGYHEARHSGVAAAGLAWGISLVLAVVVARDGARGRGLAVVPASELYLRLPGALFFFGLLATTASAKGDLAALIAYAAAFAPPYVTALALRAARRRTSVRA